MRSHEITSYRDPLDLLHRFAPTPLKVNVPLEFARVTLETNDLSFFPEAGSQASDASSHTANPGDPLPPACLWKILRDLDTRQPLAEPAIVMSGNLITYTMGPACLIAADRERKEVLAFIGIAADARIFRETIFPALCRLTEFVIRSSEPTVAHALEALPVGDACNA
jgi:hypothetical protein